MNTGAYLQSSKEESGCYRSDSGMKTALLDLHLGYDLVIEDLDETGTKAFTMMCPTSGPIPVGMAARRQPAPFGTHPDLTGHIQPGAHQVLINH
jgi:hypothetical protein